MVVLMFGRSVQEEDIHIKPCRVLSGIIFDFGVVLFWGSIPLQCVYVYYVSSCFHSGTHLAMHAYACMHLLHIYYSI